MMPSDMKVKGITGGVLITLPAVKWYQQRDMLITRIQTQERFFKGGRIALDVGGTEWTGEQLFNLLTDLSDEGMCLWAVLSSSPITRAAARRYGIATEIQLDDDKKTEKSAEPMAQAKCQWLNRSIEPGETLAVDSHLVLVGDVPAGASLSTTGSAAVWGEVHGKVMAGCNGDPGATLHMLAFSGESAWLNGHEVEIPRKLRGDLPIVVSRVGEEFTVNLVHRKRFRLL